MDLWFCHQPDESRSSMPAPIPSLFQSTVSPRCFVPTGNEFHVGAFFNRILTKFGPTAGLCGSRRPPSPWMLCPTPCGSASPGSDAPPGIRMHLGLKKYEKPHPTDLCRQVFLYNFIMFGGRGLCGGVRMAPICCYLSITLRQVSQVID